ncbi:stalk domain-containing protein [Phosphitispora sp. TUW77]|uniref:stalk domain-containing protein n=1 Tax=Phosphitispora sp. TUW77 TaxID=3152361 RepID=UPI003AB10A31
MSRKKPVIILAVLLLLLPIYAVPVSALVIVDTVDITPDLLPLSITPAAPTNLTAEVSLTVVTLTWQDNASNEDGFAIECRIGEGTFNQIGTVGANTATFTYESSDLSTTHYFRVRAYNSSSQYSAYSNVVSVSGALQLSLSPSPPTDLQADSVGWFSTQLSWTDNSEMESGYAIERKRAGEEYTSIASVGADITTFQDSSLNSSTTYYYRVKAYSFWGDSSYSNEVGITTTSFVFPDFDIDLIPVFPEGTPPTDVAAVPVSPTEICISWVDNAADEIGYGIFRKSGTLSYEQVGEVSPNSMDFSDTGLSPNTTYTYKVCTLYEGLSPSFSEEANATTPDVQVTPNEPSGLSVSIDSSSQVSFSWTDNADNETGFSVERKSGSSCYTEIAVLAADSTAYADNGLTPDTTYQYRVKAFNSMGYSANSNEVTVVMPAVTESVPAETGTQTVIRLYIDQMAYFVDDVSQSMDTAPVILEGRTLLPIRYIAEPLGATVDWDGNERKVTVNLDGKVIALWIGNSAAMVNGEYQFIDSVNPNVKPVIMPPGRTMLPVRFIAEKLGCQVEWDAVQRMVTIRYPQ